MKAILRVTARALVDLCKGLPPDDVSQACDAALLILEQHGVTIRERRQFVEFVRRATEEHESLTVSVITPSGSLGERKQSLTKVLEDALGRPVALQERANAELVGGALFEYKDERYDASLRGALRALQQQLTSA